MTSPVLVTGGTGRLGRSVVARLVKAGREVRVLARHQRDPQPQVTFYPGDLRRGAGIDAAVRGAGVIVNCATSTKGDAEMTTNLVTAANKVGSPHFVQPSIVGIDLMAAWGYVKAKREVERIVENSGLPWTILRVTQFYSYCFENSRKLAKFPLVAPVPGGFRVQPVDSREVAARLVELALDPPAGPPTCRDRRSRVGRTCSAATWRPPVSASGSSRCPYREARPCATALCSRPQITPKGSEPGISSWPKRRRCLRDENAHVATRSRMVSLRNSATGAV